MDVVLLAYSFLLAFQVIEAFVDPAVQLHRSLQELSLVVGPKDVLGKTEVPSETASILYHDRCIMKVKK